MSDEIDEKLTDEEIKLAEKTHAIQSLKASGMLKEHIDIILSIIEGSA